MADREELIERVALTQRELRRRLMADRTHPLMDVNLTMTQLKIVLMLSRADGPSSQELAAQAGVGVATMSGIIDRLVGLDLVIRQEDPRDRRVKRLTLTAAGTAQVESVLAAGEDYLHRMLGRLDDASLDLVARAYALMLDAVTPAVDVPVPGQSPEAPQNAHSSGLSPR